MINFQQKWTARSLPLKRARAKVTISHISTHSDLYQLVERVAPRTDFGRLLLGRRAILRLGLQTAGLSAVGVALLSGCGDDTGCGKEKDRFAGSILITALNLLFTYAGIGSALPNAAVLLNDSTTDVRVKVATDLYSLVRCGWMKGEESPVLTIPPGMGVIESDGTGIPPEETGEHYLASSLSYHHEGSQKTSSTFTVR